MSVISKPYLFFIDTAFAGCHRLFVLLAIGFRPLQIHKLVIGFADNLILIYTQVSFEPVVAGEVGTLPVFQPNQVRQCIDQCAPLSLPEPALINLNFLLSLMGAFGITQSFFNCWKQALQIFLANKIICSILQQADRIFKIGDIRKDEKRQCW